ncbi:hypothetical protein os1_43290 [Comamonadaceae bacterium OS-1]|nr:hypothetical protein os1_43290 [Comamonadaceae bacterium OS-1]
MDLLIILLGVSPDPRWEKRWAPLQVDETVYGCVAKSIRTYPFWCTNIQWATWRCASICSSAMKSL